jgi:hypothetical protein
VTTPSFKRLGALYKDVGLETSPDLIAARISGAQKAFEGLDLSTIPPLIRSALKLAKADEMDFLVEPLSEADLGFRPRGDDAEVSAIATVTLWELVDLATDLGNTTALGVVTAAFGGVRAYVDPDLRKYSEVTLAGRQRAARPGLAQATYRPKPVMKEDFQGLETHANSNNLAAGHPHLKKLLDGALSYTANGLIDLAQQMNRIIDHQSRLEEEMNIHWWLVGGWSHDRNMAYRDQPLPEAALRSGKELADLTKTQIGLSSASAILDLLLQKVNADSIESAAMADFVLAIPLDVRRHWTDGLLADPAVASLMPISFAAAIAAESDDAEDWKPRFKRLAGISSDAVLTPLDAAAQFYRERLLARLLSA